LSLVALIATDNSLLRLISASAAVGVGGPLEVGGRRQIFVRLCLSIILVSRVIHRFMLTATDSHFYSITLGARIVCYKCSGPAFVRVRFRNCRVPVHGSRRNAGVRGAWSSSNAGE